MHQVQNRQIVSDIFWALSKHDFDGLTKNVAEECDLWAVQDAAQLPWSGHFTGREGMRRFFEILDQSLEQNLTPDDPVVEGDRVVVTGISNSKVRATGKSIDQVWVMIWTMKNGEVVGCQYFEDSSKWASALAS